MYKDDSSVELGALEKFDLLDLRSFLKDVITNAALNWKAKRIVTDVPNTAASNGVGQVVSIGVDSGAGATVWSVDLCDDYPTAPSPASRAGR